MAVRATPLNPVQLGYVVADLPAACEQFREASGAGPFFLTSLVFENADYHGSPIESPILLDVAFCQLGDMNIELIQDKSAGPTVFNEGASGEDFRLHHTAYYADDYAREIADLAAAGYPTATQIYTTPGCPIAFADTRAVYGHYVEIYTDQPGLRWIFAYVKDQSEAWDGEQLYINLA